jgi:hypothetical protein
MKESVTQRNPLRVLLISSRRTSEPDTKSEAKTFESMIKALAMAGMEAEHRAIRFEKEFLNAIDQAEPDIVYNALCFYDHADGLSQGIQKILQDRGIACIGTKPDSLVALDSRGELRDRWRRNGVSTPFSFSIRRLQDGSLDGMDKVGSAKRFPYSIKTNSLIEGNAIRPLSISNSGADLRKKAIALSRRSDRILVEEFLGNKKGARLFTVGMIGNGDRAILMPSELYLARGKSIESVSARDIARNRAKVAPIDDKILEGELKRFSRAAIHAADVRDFARLNVIQADGKFYAIDILAQPLVPDSLFDACAAIAGLDQNQRTIAIFVAGFARLFLEGSAFIAIPPQTRTSLPRPFFSMLYG